MHALIPLLLLVSLAGSSCAGPSPRERQQERFLARLDSSLINEQKFINKQTDFLRRAFEERLAEPLSSEKAKIWKPITETVHACAKVATNQINGIITMLDTEEAYTLFTKGALSDSLYQLLARFRQTALHAHERLLEEFEHTILPHEGFCQTTTKDDVKKSVQQDFAHLTNEEARALLRYWQKEVAITENKLIEFCFYQTSSCGGGYDYTMSLVSQSHSVLAPGETLSITAGIGCYKIRANPTIHINGQAVALTDNAVAFYKLKVGQKKGKYTIPVVTEYTDADGVKKTNHIEIDYRVQ